MANPDNHPVRIEVPAGPITVEGTRRNARMLIEHVEGWLNGRGAKGIASLAGKPGVHPALMEDLAPGGCRWPRSPSGPAIGSGRARDPAEVHDFALVKRPLQSEVEDILAWLKAAAGPGGARRRAVDAEAEERYRKALKISLRWILNYTELDFRSLGSYTRADLDAIAAAPDAF